jgi:hypothetical protein
MLYFSGDQHRFDFYKNIHKDQHPYMTKDTSDFFQWTLEEMIEWEQGVIKEQTPRILEKLSELSLSNNEVLFEGMIDLSYVSKRVNSNRLVYLTVDQKLSEIEFFRRESHKGLLDSIMSCTNISEEEKARRIMLRKQAAIKAFHVDVQEHGITQLDRMNFTVAEMLQQVEKHFELVL